MSKAQYEYWMDLAAYDLDTARAMLSSKRFLYVGYMCHLTIEKASKALIALGNQVPPKTHNLIKLMELASISNRLDNVQLKLIDTLQPLNIEARYPSVKERLLKELDKGTCETLIRETEELLTWIQNM